MSIVDSASGSRRALRLDLPHTQSPQVESANIAHGHRSDASKSFLRSSYFEIKPAFEWALTFLMLCLALPLMALIALCLLVTEGRPIFYRQVRVGKNFKLFHIWKFRTMRPDAEQGTGAVWSSHSDSRVTKIGKWLRATHLDELPQVFNVLFGQMHIIGPRPERPEFVKKLILEIPNYERRLEVRPGITGLAQVLQGYDSCYSDVAKKVALDVKYIESASIGMEIKILWLTVPYIAHELLTAFNTRRRKQQMTVSPNANGRTSEVQSVATELKPSAISENSARSLEEQIQIAIREQLAAFRLELQKNATVPAPKLRTMDMNATNKQRSRS